MDKSYIDLFKVLAQSTVASAEQVMDYDREKGDEAGLKTATTMRDDFQELTDRLDNAEYTLTKSDAAKLLVGAMIMVNQLQDRMKALKTSLAGYQTDLIPKLQKIVDEAKDDTEANEMADKNFIIENND